RELDRHRELELVARLDDLGAIGRRGVFLDRGDRGVDPGVARVEISRRSGGGEQLDLAVDTDDDRGRPGDAEVLHQLGRAAAERDGAATDALALADRIELLRLRL